MGSGTFIMIKVILLFIHLENHAAIKCNFSEACFLTHVDFSFFSIKRTVLLPNQNRGVWQVYHINNISDVWNRRLLLGTPNQTQYRFSPQIGQEHC